MSASLKKDLALVFHGDVEAHAVEPVDAVKVLLEALEVFHRDADLPVDALTGDVGAAQYVEVFPHEVQLIPKGLGVRDLMIAVKRKGYPSFFALLQGSF